MENNLPQPQQPLNNMIQGQLRQADQPERNQEEQQRNQDEHQPQSILYKILKFLNLPLTKTPQCQHKYCCIQSILRDSSKIALISYLIKSGMSTVFSLKKIFSAPKHLLKILTGKDSIKFGLFVGSFVLLFRLTLCCLRRYIGEEYRRYIPLFAGFVGGLISVLFLQKKSRQTFGLFLFARAIDITYNNLVKKGYLPEFKYFYVVLYSLMMGITGYVYGTQPGSMSPEMNKFYLTFTNETLSDMQMRQIWIERKNNYLAQRGIPRQNPLDYMPKLRKYYESLKK